MMSAIDRFRQAWSARFPSEPAPEMPCLEVSLEGPLGGGVSSDGHSVYGTVYSGPSGGLNVLLVEESLKARNVAIEELHRQLERQQFVADYLWEIYHVLNNAVETNVAHARQPAPAPPTVHRYRKSARAAAAKDRRPSVPLLETDIDANEDIPMAPRPPAPAPAPPPANDNEDDALDKFIPLQESSSTAGTPTSTENVSPQLNSPSYVSPSVGPNLTESNETATASRDGSIRAKTHLKAKRQHSLPLLDQDSNIGRPGLDRIYCTDTQSELAAESNYVPMHSPMTDPSSVLLMRNSPNNSPMSSPGSGAARRTKPVPTPRVTIYKQQAASSAGSSRTMSIRVDWIDTSATSTDDAVTDNVAVVQPDALPQLAAEPRRIGSNNGNKPNTSHGTGEGSGSVKNRITAFGGSVRDGTPGTPSRPTAPVPKVTIDEVSNSPNCEESGSINRRTRRKYDDAPVYEEAAPFKRQAADSEEAGAVSSDDDEPLYYNLMLLQKQVLNRAQTWVVNADGAKPHVKKVDETQSSPMISHRRKHAADAPQCLSGDSVRSTDSDVFDDKLNGQASPVSRTKKRGMFCTTDSPESQSESDDLDNALSLYPEDEKLKMRKWVIESVLESERTYLGILDILMQYMQTFRNLLGSAQIVLSLADIETIFYGIPELHRAHKFFVRELEPCVANWSAEQQVATMFKDLSKVESKVGPDYLKNYQKAVVTIHRCWQENERFASLTKEIQVKGMKEKPSLEELLHKPVVRFQRNTLVLHDLVKCTPTSHADYDLLQKTLSSAQHFIENFDGSAYRDSPENQRYLAKQGLIVERVGNTRKLRHIFLFNDILVCAREKISTKQKISYEPKWHVPLIDLTLSDKVDVEEEKQLADCQQQEIEQLQRKFSELQGELKSELKQSRDTDVDAHRQWSFHNRSKNMDKIRKKLIEQQAAMIKASPRLLFRVHNRKTGRQYTLLMASDYERTNWRSTIAGLLSRAQVPLNVSAADLQTLLNSQKLPKINILMGIDDICLDDELLYGSLNITISDLHSLKQPADTYCTVEVDSFGHFCVKAKTKVCSASTDPVWNEEFEIDLEGAQTVRILCYSQNRDVYSVIGKCALELSKAWLRGDFLNKTVSLNAELSLKISLRYSTREQTLKRAPSNVKGGVFGARIRNVVKQEGTNIPLVIATCVQEIAERGIREVGIYRISGVAGEIQKLKKAFEKNSKVAAQMAKECDVHVLAGLLKLYFRELPEALFTDALYPSLVTGMSFSDPEAKEKYLQALFQQLPEPNHSTALYLVEHLVSVAEHEAENKMSLQNLATVFGPTLLRPAVKGTEKQTMEELFSTGARDAMLQTSILMTFFSMRKKGVSLSL